MNTYWVSFTLYFLQGVVFLMFFYVYLPVIVSFLGFQKLRNLVKRDVAIEPQSSFTFFTILIPAHNESKLLPHLLKSLQSQSYPDSFFEAVVIADNCADNTADLARKEGVTCFERHTEVPSNKAQALQYGWDMLGLLHAQYEQSTVILIDADCQVEPDFLLEIHKQISKPKAAQVLQTFRYVRNAKASNITKLDAAAEALRQWVLLGSRRLLGLQGFICGSGVVFSKGVFAQLMLSGSNTSVEDKMWQKYFLDHNIKVDWCPSARLNYDVVETHHEFQKQRKRWIGGQLELGRSVARNMMWQAVKEGNLSKMDYGLSLTQLPRSSMIVVCFVFSLVAFFVPALSLFPWWVWVAIGSSSILYISLGLALIGAHAKDYLSMFAAPQIMLGLFQSTFKSMITGKAAKWEATRSGAAKTSAEAIG